MGKKNKRKAAKGGNEGTKDLKLRRLIEDILEKCSAITGKSVVEEWNEHLVIRELVEDLLEIQDQEGIPPAVFNREAGFQEFHTWLKENGGEFEKVKLSQLESGECGLCATTNIQGGEKFLSIPSRLLLTAEAAKHSILGPLISRDKLLHVMPNVVLAVFLLSEVYKEDSFWRPYFSILPKVFNTPIHFSIEELELLRGSQVLGDALNQYKSVARQYCYLFKLFQGCKEFPFLDIFTFKDYRWAVSIVMTRQNQVPVCGGEKLSLALIPLLDMANHTHGQITTDFDLEKDSCICYTLQNTEPGEQVCIFYGPRSNAEFLMHAGFVYDENIHDRLNVKLGIGKGDPLYKTKTETLLKLGISLPRSFPLCCGPNPVTEEFLVFLRVFCMDEGELDASEGDLNQWYKDLADPDKLVSENNETKLWTFLETRCMLLLKQYPQTIEEDVKLIEDGMLSTRSKVAIQQRHAEKKILSGAREFAKQKISKNSNADGD